MLWKLELLYMLPVFTFRGQPIVIVMHEVARKKDQNNLLLRKVKINLKAINIIWRLTSKNFQLIQGFRVARSF